MKTLKLFTVLILLLALFGCEEKENKQTEVEKYVTALKNNQYENRNLPAFTYKHIDELLKYRNERDIITKFPRNPISSFYQEECKLGICILWTIEYIRIKSVDVNLLSVGEFPSQNSILWLRDSEEGFVSTYDLQAHRIASNAYYTWWTSNRGETLIEIMEIDPLENTIYKWH